MNLLAGAEFDSPHRYPKELAALSALPYDCIIGSVHFCGLSPDLYFSTLIANGITAETCYRGYWKEVQKCVSAGGFDVLGHLDIPKRYYKVLHYNEAEIRMIFRTMVDNGIVLEINTSTLRRDLPDTMPGRDLLALYRAEGGSCVTVCSDAHSAIDLAAGNAIARELLEDLGLREVIFVRRKRIEV